MAGFTPLQLLLTCILVASAAALGYGVSVVIAMVRGRSAKRAAARVLDDARQEAERIKKDAFLSAKEELFKKKESFEQENQEIRRELKQIERRLEKREDGLERKLEVLARKERTLELAERDLTVKQREVETKRQDLEELVTKEREALQRTSGLTQEQAKEMLLKELESEVEHESAQMISRVVERANEQARAKAQEIIALAVQRCAADHSAEMVVSAIDLPNDEMKGRIIGREGRNIRAFEKATGVDVIVDDTPGVVVVSGFDSVRREIARRSMEKLIVDGRIHPTRIEEVVGQTREEVEQAIQEAGEQTALEVDVRGLHPKLVNLLGRLRFRSSFGQNVLQHSIEVAHLSGLLASELKLDAQLAKRCGLLHDIGKAVDHEVEGSHPEIGADLARRYEENPIVVNAIAGHHESAPARSLYAVVVSAADSISAGRPGARRESLEKYIKRLEQLEHIAGAYPGVEAAYAIQAGREVRVIVNSEKISDSEAVALCRNIAKDIERELTYPGEVKVTLLRETRVVEYAR